MWSTGVDWSPAPARLSTSRMGRLTRRVAPAYRLPPLWAFTGAPPPTPFGRHGGALATVRPDDLAALPIRALVERLPRVDWAALDEVILGCANQAGEDNRNVARMAALLSGLPASVPGVTVNRLCGSGLEAVGQAARAIGSGEAELVLAGGVESMSRSPYVLAKAGAAVARDQRARGHA